MRKSITESNVFAAFLCLLFALVLFACTMSGCKTTNHCAAYDKHLDHITK